MNRARLPQRTHGGRRRLLDVTLTRDRQISGIFAVDPVNAHAAGVRFLQETCLEQIDEPADLVVTSSAGFPLDLTFYQSLARNFWKPQMPVFATPAHLGFF